MPSVSGAGPWGVSPPSEELLKCWENKRWTAYRVETWWLLSPRLFSNQWRVVPELLLHFREPCLLSFFWVSSVFLHLCLSVNKNGQLNLFIYLAEVSDLLQLKQKFGGEGKSLKKCWNCSFLWFKTKSFYNGGGGGGSLGENCFLQWWPLPGAACHRLLQPCLHHRAYSLHLVLCWSQLYWSNTPGSTSPLLPNFSLEQTLFFPSTGSNRKGLFSSTFF